MAQLVERAQRSFIAGMNDASEPDEYTEQEVAAMYNARVSHNGDAAERRGGSKRSHSSALNSGARIYGATEFYDADGDRFLVVIAGSVAYTSADDGVTWTQRATGLPLGAWDFTVMQSGAARLLIAVVGSGAPQTWDGTTWQDLTGSGIPSDALVCEYHNNRLWLWPDGVTLYGSKVDDPTIFTVASGGVTVRIENPNGDPTPRGLWSFGPALLAFTLDNVGFVEGWGLNSIQVLTGHRGLSRSLGCVSHRTIAAAGDTGLIWLSKQGFVFMPLGGSPVLISGQIERFTDSIAWDNVTDNPDIPAAIWYALQHEYHCSVPASGNNQNTHTVVIRPPSASRPLGIWINRAEEDDDQSFIITDGVLELTTGGREAAITGGVLELLDAGESGLAATLTDNVLELATNNFLPATLFIADHETENETAVLWSGGYDGFVRREDYGDKDDVLSDGTGGEDINAWIRTRPDAWDDQFRRKHIRSVRTAVKAEAGGTLSVAPVVDGVVGTETDHTLTAQATTQVIRTRVTGRGYIGQVDLRFTDALTIQGCAPAAALMDEGL